MSGKITDALSAMDYARKAMDKAKILFYTIDSAKKEDSVWLVKAIGLMVKYIIRIDANTGDILEFTRTNH